MSGGGYLLDTNIISEFNRTTPPNANVRHWVASTSSSLLYVSVVTLSEIRFGTELLVEGKRRKSLEHWLEHDLHEWFDNGRILNVDERIGAVWATMTAQRQFKGRPLDILDGLIAATAFAHNLTVATRNTKDFADLGLEIINPWE